MCKLQAVANRNLPQGYREEARIAIMKPCCNHALQRHQEAQVRYKACSQRARGGFRAANRVDAANQEISEPKRTCRSKTRVKTADARQF